MTKDLNIGFLVSNPGTVVVMGEESRDFIDATAGIRITEQEVVVRFQKRAHNPQLIAAGFDTTDVVIPWLGGKRLRLVFG